MLLLVQGGPEPGGSEAVSAPSLHLSFFCGFELSLRLSLILLQPGRRCTVRVQRFVVPPGDGVELCHKDYKMSGEGSGFGRVEMPHRYLPIDNFDNLRTGILCGAPHSPPLSGFLIDNNDHIYSWLTLFFIN